MMTIVMLTAIMMMSDKQKVEEDNSNSGDTVG